MLSSWRAGPAHGSQPGVTTFPSPYRGFRFPAAVIEHAVWLYHCFDLSLRDVESCASRVVPTRVSRTRSIMPSPAKPGQLCSFRS